MLRHYLAPPMMSLGYALLILPMSTTSTDNLNVKSLKVHEVGTDNEAVIDGLVIVAFPDNLKLYPEESGVFAQAILKKDVKVNNFRLDTVEFVKGGKGIITD